MFDWFWVLRCLGVELRVSSDEEARRLDEGLRVGAHGAQYVVLMKGRIRGMQLESPPTIWQGNRTSCAPLCAHGDGGLS